MQSRKTIKKALTDSPTSAVAPSAARTHGVRPARFAGLWGTEAGSTAGKGGASLPRSVAAGEPYFLGGVSGSSTQKDSQQRTKSTISLSNACALQRKQHFLGLSYTTQRMRCLTGGSAHPASRCLSLLGGSFPGLLLALRLADEGVLQQRWPAEAVPRVLCQQSLCHLSTCDGFHMHVNPCPNYY